MAKSNAAKCLTWLKKNHDIVVFVILTSIFAAISAATQFFGEAMLEMYREYAMLKTKPYMAPIILDLTICVSCGIFYEVMRRKERYRRQHLVEVYRQCRYACLFGMEYEFLRYLHEQGILVREPRRRRLHHSFRHRRYGRLL